MKGREDNQVFDKEGFMAYLSGISAGTDQEWQRLLEGIIRYGMLYHTEEKDELCWFLSDIIPGLAFGEAAMFASDESLSPYGRLKKINAGRIRGADVYATVR